MQKHVTTSISLKISLYIHFIKHLKHALILYHFMWCLHTFKIIFRGSQPRIVLITTGLDMLEFKYPKPYVHTITLVKTVKLYIVFCLFYHGNYSSTLNIFVSPVFIICFSSCSYFMFIKVIGPLGAV